MIEFIINHLKDNGYNASNLQDALNNHGDRRYKMHWQACSMSMRSGILSYMGRRYYFNCISPWDLCPEGNITVEVLAR